jgi:hypothetical protein
MADASPDPPPGRKKKIEYSEVSQYMDEVGGEVSSRGEVDDLDMHSFGAPFPLIHLSWMMMS